MASERVDRAIAYLNGGRRELGPLKEMGLSADEYNEVLAAVSWGYATSPHMKDAVQNLYEQRRAEEAAGRGAGERRREERAPRYGKWQIERELSPGGQANTFLVKDRTSTGAQSYVLKVLKNPKRLERFVDEVRGATRLDHPNIVRVVDSDLTTERPYLVTEYCEGGALDQANLTTLSVLERLRMFAAICSAVAYAHDKGVIHRDLKPANIFLRGDGRTPVIGDFGLCFLTDGDERRTHPEEAVGARWYMAPELEDGRSDYVGPWSDLYSLGKVLYWMMAGRVFNREKHRDDEFDLTRSAEATDIFFVYDALDGALVADRQRRLQSVQQLARIVGVAMARIEKGAHVLDFSVRQVCNFCGLGAYKQVANTAHGHANVKNFGLDPAGIWEGFILACEHCGHVQMFRTDLGRQGAWKGFRPRERLLTRRGGPSISCHTMLTW